MIKEENPFLETYKILKLQGILESYNEKKEKREKKDIESQEIENTINILKCREIFFIMKKPIPPWYKIKLSTIYEVQ